MGAQTSINHSSLRFWRFFFLGGVRKDLTLIIDASILFYFFAPPTFFRVFFFFSPPLPSFFFLFYSSSRQFYINSVKINSYNLFHSLSSIRHISLFLPFQHIYLSIYVHDILQCVYIYLCTLGYFVYFYKLINFSVIVSNSQSINKFCDLIQIIAIHINKLLKSVFFLSQFIFVWEQHVMISSREPSSSFRESGHNEGSVIQAKLRLFHKHV